MRPGDRLPVGEYRDRRDGRLVRLRDQSLGSPVVFVAHGPDCEGCRRYLGELAGLDEACRLWDGRRVAFLPDGEGEPVPGEEAGFDPPFPLVAPAGEAARRLADPGNAALIVADRFGECFHVDEVGPHHHAGLPRGREIESWLRFIAVQCPECGVPDSAGDAGR